MGVVKITEPNKIIRDLAFDGTELKLSAEETDAYQNASGNLKQLYDIELLWGVVVSSYDEFENTMNQISQDELLGKNDHDQLTSAELFIKTNLKLLAFLTAVKSYHDQRPQVLKQLSEVDGSFVEEIKKVFRVWTQLSQHLIAKSCTIPRKLTFSFSYRVVSRRISFILQKKRSTRLRIA